MSSNNCPLHGIIDRIARAEAARIPTLPTSPSFLKIKHHHDWALSEQRILVSWLECNRQKYSFDLPDMEIVEKGKTVLEILEDRQGRLTLPVLRSFQALADRRIKSRESEESNGALKRIATYRKSIPQPVLLSPIFEDGDEHAGEESVHCHTFSGILRKTMPEGPNPLLVAMSSAAEASLDRPFSGRAGGIVKLSLMDCKLLEWQVLAEFHQKARIPGPLPKTASALHSRIFKHCEQAPDAITIDQSSMDILPEDMPAEVKLYLTVRALQGQKSYLMGKLSECMYIAAGQETERSTFWEAVSEVLLLAGRVHRSAFQCKDDWRRFLRKSFLAS